MSDNSTLERLFDSGCQLCGLCSEASTVCLPGRGNPNADIMLVGDFPGYAEDAQGLPFVGESGQLLTRLLDEAGISEDDVYFTSMVKCCPGRRDPGVSEITTCAQNYFFEEIDHVRPKVIVTLGRVSTSMMLGKPGEKIIMGKVRSYPIREEFDDDYIATIVPTWNPVYAMRRESAQPEIVADLRIAANIASGSANKGDYRYVNDIDNVDYFCNLIVEQHRKGELQHGFVAVDIETNQVIVRGEEPDPWSDKWNIATLQLSWEAGQGILIPVVREGSVFNNKLGITALCASLKKVFDEVPVVGHNFRFDYSWIYAKLGLEVKNVVMDTMLAAHTVAGAVTPLGLGDLTVRHLGIPSHKDVIDTAMADQPAETRNYGAIPTDILVEYGCADTDYTLQLAAKLKKDMEDFTYEEFDRPVMFSNMWEAFQRNTMFPWKCITNMEIRGAHIDQETCNKVAEDLLKDKQACIDYIVGSEFSKKFSDMFREKNTKRERERRAVRYKAVCQKCGNDTLHEPPINKAGYKCPDCGSMDTAVTRVQVGTGEFYIVDSQPEWIEKVLNPASHKQMSNLIYDIMGLPMTKAGTRSVDVNARKELLSYCNYHRLDAEKSIIERYAEFNVFSKLYSSYAVAIPNFITVDADSEDTYPTAHVSPVRALNCIHTTFKQHGTKTGRLSSAKPNLQNLPRSSSIKRVFTSRFEDGFIVQADFSQAEIRGIVVESGEESLRQAYLAGVDIHRKTASNATKKPIEMVTDEERQAAKAIIFGLIYGRGAKAIAEATALSLEEAQALINGFLDENYKIKEWIAYQKKLVRKHRLAISRLGRIRNLEEFFRDLEDREAIGQAERAGVNHPIQGLAGDFCLNGMARLDYRMVELKMASLIFGTVHDSVIADVHPAEFKSYVVMAKEEMEDKLPESFPFLNLPMKIDLEVGPTWKDAVNLSWEGDLFTFQGETSYVNYVVSSLKKNSGAKIESLHSIKYDDGKPTGNLKAELIL